MSEEQGNYITERIKRENAALRKYSAIQKAAEDKIGVQKIYIDMTNDIPAAFILDEIIFFTLPKNGTRSSLRIWKDGYLWMAVQRKDWWDRKRLTERQADTAIKKLEELNLIVKSVHKFNGQSSQHFRLNIPEFFRQYGEALEKDNPPEDQSETLTKDISDLYEMLGESPNGELQNGDSRIRDGESPNGETELQNGDSINIPHHPSLNPNGAKAPSPLREIEDSANKTVDAILDNARKAEELKESSWLGRENYPPNLLVYADWWQKKTGLSAGRKLSKSNLKAFNDWYSVQANEYALEKAWDSFEWQRKQGTLTTEPNKLTAQVKGWMSTPQTDQSKRDPNETANESRLRSIGI